MPSEMYDETLIKSNDTEVKTAGTSLRKTIVGVAVLTLAVGALAGYALRTTQEPESHKVQIISGSNAAGVAQHGYLDDLKKRMSGFGALGLGGSPGGSLNPSGNCHVKKVNLDQLSSGMLPQGVGPQTWEAAGIPMNLRGIWWTAFSTTVMTYLYDNPNRVVANGDYKTTCPAYRKNTWSTPTPLLGSFSRYANAAAYDDAGEKNLQGNIKGKFAYEFTFKKIKGSSTYNYADISLSGIPTPFNMGAYDYSSQCGNGPGAGKTAMQLTGVKAASKMTSAEKAEQKCGPDELWRRNSGFGIGQTLDGEKGLSILRYDVVKIVDQYGRPIQPQFNNWKKAMASLNQPYVLLPGDGCN